MRRSEKEELIYKLVERAFVCVHDPRKPGEVIRKLPHEMREKVAALTSDDFKDVGSRPLKP